MAVWYPCTLGMAPLGLISCQVLAWEPLKGMPCWVCSSQCFRIDSTWHFCCTEIRLCSFQIVCSAFVRPLFYHSGRSQMTCAHQNDSLAPKFKCVGLINQPFKLGTRGLGFLRGGDCGLVRGDVLQWTNNHLGWELGRTGGFRGGDWGLIWRCSQPFRLGLGGDW